jgi:hypothetical protein
MPPDDKLPPELKTVSKEEFREVYTAATRLALGLMKSRTLADELVSDTFEALLTTRRWDPARGPLLRHVLGSMTSIRSNKFKKNKAGERTTNADKAYQRE